MSVALIVMLLATAQGTTPAPVIVVPPPALRDDAPQIDPAKLEVARQIIAIVLPPDQREAMIDRTLDAMMKAILAGSMRANGLDAKLNDNPKLRDVFARFVDRQRQLAKDDLHKALPDLVEAYARAYARIFTLEDLQAINAFVHTPAGARYVQRSPELISDPDVAAWQRDIAARAAARQPAELERLKQEMIEAAKAPPSGA